jgi:hypothetical protein
MPLTSAQLVRQRIQDLPAYNDIATMIGDGTANSFKLPHVNLTTASAYVPVAAGWSATGATFDATFGIVSFPSAFSAQSAFRVTYVHTVFAEAVIDEYVSAYGVLGAALQCAYDLQFDALKRAKWRSPAGDEYDDTDARNALKDIISALTHEQEQDAIFGGGFNSWSVTQAE